MLAVDIQRKAFGAGPDVIRGLHFNVAQGEQVAILGPSGAGKSSLLNLTVGLDTDFSGSVVAPTDLVATQMFQEPRLMPWLTVQENLLLVVENNQHNKERAWQLLQAVGLEKERDWFPGQLSGGMKKRAALARAFMPEPNLLLMDEPFASLDLPTAQELRTLVRDMCQAQQVTLLCVTHDLAEAVTLADRLLFFAKDPMALVLDKDIKPWKQSGDDVEYIDHCCQAILQQHPSILRGIA